MDGLQGSGLVSVLMWPHQGRHNHVGHNHDQARDAPGHQLLPHRDDCAVPAGAGVDGQGDVVQPQQKSGLVTLILRSAVIIIISIISSSSTQQNVITDLLGIIWFRSQGFFSKSTPSTETQLFEDLRHAVIVNHWHYVSPFLKGGEGRI